jgi:hypothetical protein
MAGERDSGSDGGAERREELTKAELLRLAEEALARRRVHRERFFEALEQLEKLAKRR